MKKGIVVFSSKYGAAEKYAGWLSEALDFDLAAEKKCCSDTLKDYEKIIFCGGVYASGISGIRLLKQNASALSGKKKAVLAVGASPYDEKAFRELKAHNLGGEMSNVTMFYARGAWNEDKMSFTDRIMCKMLQKAVAKKPQEEMEPWMSALMGAIGQNCDWTDKAYIKDLIEYMKK